MCHTLAVLVFGQTRDVLSWGLETQVEIGLLNTWPNQIQQLSQPTTQQTGLKKVGLTVENDLNRLTPTRNLEHAGHSPVQVESLFHVGWGKLLLERHTLTRKRDLHLVLKLFQVQK